MPLSREELRRKLQESLSNGNGNGSEPKPAVVEKPKAKSESNPFRRRMKPVEVVEEEVDGAAVAVAEEEDEVEDSPLPETTHRTPEPEVTPAEELVDFAKEFIDFVAANRAALKSWLDSVR